MAPTRAMLRCTGVVPLWAYLRWRREPEAGSDRALSSTAPEITWTVSGWCEGRLAADERRRGLGDAGSSVTVSSGASISSAMEDVGEGGISYGSGTSREARKRPTLVQCSFSTRKRVQMPRRRTSEKAIKKLRRAECCKSFEKRA